MGEAVCIFRRDLSEFRLGALRLDPPGHDVSVGKGDLDRRVAGNHAQAVFGESRSSITSGRSMLAM